MSKKNDMNKEIDVDKGNNKSSGETLKAMFEGNSIGEPADKLKTQVKGYSVTMITERMLKKNKLGVSSETSRCGAALSLIKKILPGVS